MKKFLVIGNQNAITYKDIFPLIKENKMWLGYGFSGNVAHFNSPYNDYARANNHKEGMIRVSGVMWFTNLEHSKRHEKIDLYKHYNPEEYPKYDNYDAIDVSKVCEIPMGYYGFMGVPITFLDKYCPEQFEILDGRDYALNDKQRNKSTYLIKDADGAINGKAVYARILIRIKK